MATQTAYQNKLLDPRWQKKRLKILERDNFTCQSCTNTKKTLEIHHQKYGRYPWSVDDKFLITYCNECHEIIETLIKAYPSLKIFRIEVKTKPCNSEKFIACYCIDSRFNLHQVTLFIFENGKLIEDSAISEQSLIHFYNIIQLLKDE